MLRHLGFQVVVAENGKQALAAAEAAQDLALVLMDVQMPVMGGFEATQLLRARQAATGLYHVVTMAAMRWEAKQAQMPMRSHLADLILKHRLAARDPLQGDHLTDAALCEWLAQTV